MAAQTPPQGVKLSTDIEYRPGNPNPHRARVRWFDPQTKRRLSRSEMLPDEKAAQAWIDRMERAANRGITPATATMTLAEYGDEEWDLAMRGLEAKTMDPYRAGWRLRVVPSLGHIPVQVITNGVVDRAVYAWIADECSRSTVKNSLAVLVRVMEQAVRDGIIDLNPARVVGWQQEYKRAEDELDDPRSLALPDWDALDRLAVALVARSAGEFEGWADVVRFEACTATRIGEVSGVRAGDINREEWTWEVCRQTTPGPGGLIDKGTKGKRRRTVPIIPEIRPMVARRLDAAGRDPMARLFTGPRGGRISTAVLRDATHWDDVVSRLGYEHLRRHDLRHTGLTWMADAGVPVHVLRKIAGHGSLTTTQRYLHPSRRSIDLAGAALSAHLSGDKIHSQMAPSGPKVVPSEAPRRHLRVVR
ncbi:tyrosine-type recombinase/integrase [Actinacidiphila sp. ITFR-21]|uniref:tyrosine-type recombinase/integrase n=1 Tax=Actinacidiphila sp. ITFR-21 TaxID=3075199 RepID=UPI00288C2ED5|nr:site-specific integrase [Streptomyces sp. ITFR-21]WNI18699.1 site-specific integrase [Streptomyces sp. ITFR-21]